MRDIWTEGSGARKRGWYDNPIYTSKTPYHPTRQDRSNAQHTSVEYIEPPERYALKHPTQAAIQKHTIAATDKAIHILQAIPTCRISEFNQGILLASQWINIGIGALVGVCSVLELIWLIFAICVQKIPAEYILSYGFHAAIVCTICILIYRYHKILQKRFARANVLRKRHQIVVSTKHTLFMLCKTLLLLYGVLIPQIAKISLAI